MHTVVGVEGAKELKLKLDNMENYLNILLLFARAPSSRLSVSVISNVFLFYSQSQFVVKLF